MKDSWDVKQYSTNQIELQELDTVCFSICRRLVVTSWISFKWIISQPIPGSHHIAIIWWCKVLFNQFSPKKLILCDEELFLAFFTDNVPWTRGGCDRSAGDAYSSVAPDPTHFRGPFCPMLTRFVYLFWAFLAILTLVSLILVYLKRLILTCSTLHISFTCFFIQKCEYIFVLQTHYARILQYNFPRGNLVKLKFLS